MSHEAALLFLPCWILPFPWYFPSSGQGSRGDTDSGQGFAGTRGRAQPWPGEPPTPKAAGFPHLCSPDTHGCRNKSNEQKMEPFFMHLQTQVWHCLSSEDGNFRIKHLQEPFPTNPYLPKPLHLIENPKHLQPKGNAVAGHRSLDTQLHFMPQMLWTSEEDSGVSSIDPAHDTEGHIRTAAHNCCFQFALTVTLNFIASLFIRWRLIFVFKNGIIAMKRSTSKRRVVGFCSF